MNRGRACSPVLPTERIAYLGRGVRLLRCGISNQLMSQMGHLRPNWTVRAMSAFLPLATELRTLLEVRFVPNADIQPEVGRRDFYSLSKYVAMTKVVHKVGRFRALLICFVTGASQCCSLT